MYTMLLYYCNLGLEMFKCSAKLFPDSELAVERPQLLNGGDPVVCHLVGREAEFRRSESLSRWV